jgi:pentatricopeptide repeat protein
VNDTITALLIRIVAKGRFRGAANRAESLLKDAVRKFPPNQFDGINTEVCNSVVLAWAKSREDGGPQRAQELIVYMDGLDAPQCKPNRFTFTSLIDAYAQTNEWDGVREAERIFNNVLDQYIDDHQTDLEPNVATWTIVISAWARLSKRNRKGAAKRAGNLLKRMEQLCSDGRINVKPDAITYWTCLNAYAFSKEKEDIEDGEQLLEEMNELYLDGDDAMKPSLLSIKLLVDAWIKIGEMDRAEQVIEKYEEYVVEEQDSNNKDVKGLEELYESFLFGYCKDGDPKRAKVYLDMMADDENIEPSNACYDRIIDAYIKKEGTKCAKNAHEIFEMMERRRQVGALSPSERVYTSFIRALAKSRVPGLHKKVELILNRMNKLYEEGKVADMKPSVYTYNCALNACSECLQIESVSPSEAFQTSVRIFAELRKETDPDHVTFGNLIRCSNLLPESETEKKVKFVKATFQLCRDNGLVNNLVLRDLKNAASNELWAELTKIPLDVSTEDESILDFLPSSWSKNVKRRQPDNRVVERPRRKFNANR